MELSQNSKFWIGKHLKASSRAQTTTLMGQWKQIQYFMPKSSRKHSELSKIQTKTDETLSSINLKYGMLLFRSMTVKRHTVKT